MKQKKQQQQKTALNFLLGTLIKTGKTVTQKFEVISDSTSREMNSQSRQNTASL